MAVKPFKIKIKEPTPSAADRMYAKQQAIRKEKGLPDPSEYKKKIDSMKTEAKDSKEYDYEGDMAKSDLRSIIHNAQTLHDMLDDKTNLAEWVQSKITLAEDYISTVTNYMRSEMNEEVEQLDEVGDTPAGRKALGTYINRSHESGDAARISATYDKDNFAKHTKTVAKRSSGIAKAVTRLVKEEEVEPLDEISAELKASYVAGAKKQIKQSIPYTKKGQEYRDIAKNFIAKREKGIAKVTEQHVEGRFKPVKPRNVKNIGTASPRPTSDSSDVRLKEEDEMKADQMTTDNQKFPKKAKMSWEDMMNKDGSVKKSKKAQIVRAAAKKKTNSEDQFQANPILDSDVNPQTNKQ